MAVKSDRKKRGAEVKKASMEQLSVQRGRICPLWAEACMSKHTPKSFCAEIDPNREEGVIRNPDFNVTGFRSIRDEGGCNGFVLTTKQWTEKTNMGNINFGLINEGVPQRDRLLKLNSIAIQQMRILNEVEGRRFLE